MYKRTDEGGEVIEIASQYYCAMVNSDAETLRRVFHPDAIVVGNFGEDLEFSGLEGFIATTGDAKTGDQPFEYRVDGLTLVGDTAVVTVSGYCYETMFTDHLSLVKIDGRWQIVAKTFYAHPG